MNAFALLVKGTVIDGTASLLLVLTLNTDTMAKLWTKVTRKRTKGTCQGGPTGARVAGLRVDLLTRGYIEKKTKPLFG